MQEDKTKYIAVCSAGIDDEGSVKMLEFIHDLAPEYDFKLLYFNSFSNLCDFEKHDLGESNIFHLINYNIVDGMIILSETIKTESVRNEIVEKANIYDIPVVCIDNACDGCYNINYTYKSAIKAIVLHLIDEHKFTKINFIAGSKGNVYSEDRLDAYKEALASKNIPFEEKRVGYGEFWNMPVKKIIEDFIDCDLPFPEAIVCANDTMALAAIDYLAQKGYSVPEDVAVTGLDGIEEVVNHIPSVTTAVYDYDKTIRCALDILKKYFDGEDPDELTWIELQPVFAGTCCNNDDRSWKNSSVTRRLYSDIEEWQRYQRRQIALSADLTDNESFQGIFENLKRYVENFHTERFWLCIIDDFLTQKDNLMEIIEETSYKRTGYSSTMDLMLSWDRGEWQGIIDFHTGSILPNLDVILEKEGNVMFFPLHVLEQTIGYIALVYNPKIMNLYFIYQFFMNISNALENTRVHQRQQAIIDNLKLKYVHDPMTGLFNRRGFYQRLEVVFKDCRLESKKLSVVSVDLNGLKQINDTYGHADGDIAINTIGKALAAVAPTKFTCARFGGDEFVVAGQVDNDKEVEVFADNVKKYLETFNEQSDKPYKVSASIGYVTGIPNLQISLDEFIKIADEKMYEDKVKYHSRSRK